MADVAPIASGPDYATDVREAHRFDQLVADGHATTLPEAALRFAIAQKAMTTVLIGTSTLDQLEVAIAAAEKGPLPREALDRVAALTRG
jgi:L-galactose dehydrogenase/L-glyceraldehyde 3-phosphate reductase